MPSRRTFLRAAGATALAAGVAGCSGSGSGDTGPAYERWLYDPGPAVEAPLPWQAFLSVDVPAAWARRDQLPEEWVATASSFDRTVETVDLTDLDRITALGFGSADLTTLGATAAVTGDVDAAAVADEFAAGSSVVAHDPVAGYRLFGYAPAFFERIRRNDVTARGTLGLAVTDGCAVAGGLLSPDGHAVAPVARMVRAGAGPGDDGGVAPPDGDLRSVVRALDDPAVGVPPVASGIGFDEGVALTISEAIPPQWPTLAATVDDIRAFGVGLRFATDETLTEFVFVYDPRTIAEDENISAAIRKFTNESANPDSGIIGARLGPDGRSLVVRTTVSPETLWRDFADELPLLG
jgi:hypothetical protein